MTQTPVYFYFIFGEGKAASRRTGYQIHHIAATLTQKKEKKKIVLPWRRSSG